MDNDLLTILSTGGKSGTGASASAAGVSGTTTSAPGRGNVPDNSVLDALVARLTEQGKGISTSSSSNLQNSINQAISDTQKSGDLTKQALQSERSREIGFARDRAGATYDTALEGRTGYATQVAGLRELTETTEKSIRDLDKRYQEAMLANDAGTAQRVADMRMKKEEFLMTQEQNFFSNVMSVAGMKQNAIGQLMQSEQFWAGQEESQRQFAMNMAQSSYQFEKNLGISYKELDMKSQELDIARDRNQISREELQLRRSEINKEKNNLTTQGILQQRMLDMKKQGIDVNSMDKLSLFGDLYAEIMSRNPNFDLDNETFNTIAMQAYSNVSDVSTTVAPESTRVGGVFGEGGIGGKVASYLAQPYVQGFEKLFGTKQ